MPFEDYRGAVAVGIRSYWLAVSYFSPSKWVVILI